MIKIDLFIILNSIILQANYIYNTCIHVVMFTVLYYIYIVMYSSLFLVFVDFPNC